MKIRTKFQLLRLLLQSWLVEFGILIADGLSDHI